MPEPIYRRTYRDLEEIDARDSIDPQSGNNRAREIMIHVRYDHWFEKTMITHWIFRLSASSRKPDQRQPMQYNSC